MTKGLPAGQASAAEIRGRLVDALRRDLIGPGPQDADLADERLKENPSRWYLAGFLAPALDGATDGTETLEDVGDPLFGDDEAADPETGAARAADDAPPDEPSARKSRVPSSCGLTVLIDASVREVEVTLTWGDYVTIPPVPEEVFTDETRQFEPAYRTVEWQRVPGWGLLRLPVPENGRGDRVIVPGSAGAQRPGGALTLEAHARPYTLDQPDGKRHLRALTIMVVNRRNNEGRRFSDVTFAFQVRLEIRCAEGLHPRGDLTGYGASDPDAALADLHYRDVADYAVGCNTSAGWQPDDDGVVRAAHSDFLPAAEVERVEPNEAITDVEFGMEALAALAATGPEALCDALHPLPEHYEAWIALQQAAIGSIDGAPRQATAERLIASARQARERIVAGIELLRTDPHARLAFRAMNEAIARGARQRVAGHGGDPAAQPAPRWRPFQLAFILLNLSGLQDGLHRDREIVDLLFFPTGGGKTEAYLGLAAWTIAHRRITNRGTLGAGVAVLMRYTLRLLTLDQLSRASGVVCALELMRGQPAWQENGRNLLGDWPIEIGLWVGSAASPNRLGKTGDGRPDNAVARVRRFQKDGREAPAPIKACPWCATPFERQSFACVPTAQAPRNMEIRCANSACAFTGRRSLPVLTVDEVIYRRLPAFIIATVDKFAGLPWLAEAGAFFGHVDREDEWGFYGAADAIGMGRPLFGGATLLPPSLIIQDELHLMSGPLGTVAALYEVALDRLATREWKGQRVRPKVVASTATVRRASAQIEALFDRHRTEIFPPPGPDRRDSFFAKTVPPAEKPARLYVGLAAPGRGPKLVFLRVLTTLLAGAEKEALAGNEADPYLTALCYFNALRELGGARRIVEDEVRARLATYGTERRRHAPLDEPFANRRLRDVLELTSRENTDKVAAAKEALGRPCSDPQGVDVALATNMISVGLDIGRLGLMVVQGQPKSAAEYIQATSRVGRQPDKPGLVLAILNAHKPRDRLHYEGFRHFHECFYRAVEATSVTPWAARAMDRALAAVVVAAARHLFPDLTPESGADEIVDCETARTEIVQMILDRAPQGNVAGGHAALRAAIENLLDSWEALADDRRANAERFYYGYPRDKALLHDPLDPLIDGLDPRYRLFTAGRSMRDVEHASILKITDPYGNVLN
jgi:hypothetical protein